MNKCKYCENDGYYTPNKYLIDKEFETKEDYHWCNLMINCKDKTIVMGVDNEEKFNKIITKKINYCPVCGRNLEKEVS